MRQRSQIPARMIGSVTSLVLNLWGRRSQPPECESPRPIHFSFFTPRGDVGDTTKLANPEIVQEVPKVVKGGG